MEKAQESICCHMESKEVDNQSWGRTSVTRPKDYLESRIQATPGLPLHPLHLPLHMCQPYFLITTAQCWTRLGTGERVSWKLCWEQSPKIPSKECIGSLRPSTQIWTAREATVGGAARGSDWPPWICPVGQSTKIWELGEGREVGLWQGRNSWIKQRWGRVAPRKENGAGNHIYSLSIKWDG
jgi:hypothetical protein